ncbi:unnamed protein product [Rotaria sordida]|nr:unnamed protein product [Rotaria sordida]CAF1351556.1 unnamed protein product [Rotaria sordida]
MDNFSSANVVSWLQTFIADESIIRYFRGVFCGSRYSSFDSYRSHIYRYHRSLIDSFDNNDTVSSNIDDIVDDLEKLFSHPTFSNQSHLINDPESCIYPDEELDDTDREFLNLDLTTSSITNEQLGFGKLAQFYTRFLLELREYHLLPQKVVQSISSSICSLFDIIIKLISRKASSSFVSIIDMETIFTHVNWIINSVSKSEYSFLKQCKNYFDYQPPTEIVLHTTEERAYYIPLKQSLSSMLQNGQLLQAIIDNINSLSTRAAKDNDLILSNRQSRSVKSNLSRQTSSNALLLKLYTDGIAITNPIGPKKDSHKFTCFYYLLDDLPDIVRSQVNSIGLHCICYTKHLKKDNDRLILMKILVEDLNKLQTEGITIPCLSSRIYFVFSTLCGDNLASNEVGGFQQSFSSGSFCRHCFVTYEQRHIPLTDISFVPRTRLKHDMIVNKVIANNDGQIIQGVKSESWFKDLIGFHATESLPPDLMHDIAEGMCPLIISALLKETIQQRLLTYAEIEQRTSCFNYGFYDSSNKPPPVKKQQLSHSNIAGSASQKLCFFRLFPIVFRDIIDDLTLLPLYTILREIISYIYANPVRKSWLSYLDGLCKQFHSLMIEHLPDHVTPKVHFVTEYPRSIEIHGLPILNSCIRFEAKHLYFKQIAIRTFNFKNPLLTLSKRHQLRHCMLNNSNSFSYSSSITVRSSKSIEWSKLSIPVRRLLMDHVNQTDLICEYTSIYYHHINIRTGSIVVHHLVHAEEIPVFCQIHHLLNIKEKCIIIAEMLNTVSFNEKLWSYEVEFTETLVKIDIEHYEDIDGSTLILLQHNDIAEIFPRIKDRVKFVDQRTKLILNLNEQNENTDGTTTTTNIFDLTSSSSSSFKPVDSLQENDILSPSVLNEKNESNNDIHQITDTNLSSSITFSDDNDDIYAKAKLPSDYQGPDLTIRMQHYVDDNNISKFNPHTALRGELLSLLFDDVTKSYQLLYPTNDEYLTMAKCLVKKLHVPSALYHDVVKDWHESIKQKFKRERKPLQITTNFVKSKQEKYGNGKTNGRPKKKSTILQAERRINDIPIISIADRQNENILSIVDQMKLQLLKDDPDLDFFRNLWRQSFNIRRLCIRDLTVTEILERFPGYRLSEMILAEVKECTDVNIEENVNDLLPKFFDHLPDNNCFLSDVLPIRIIRILCKFFGDPVGNIFTHEDVLVPYPCMKIYEDRFELYLDFCLITETTSSSTAVALLVSLYYVFEIRFGLHNRTCRLLYGILFEDSHYLNKALKNLLNNWQYKIANRPLMKRQAMITNLIENSTQPSIVNKNNSSSSNNSNQIVDESLEQIEQDQYSSSYLNLTRSTNIDQQYLNEQNDDDLNQLSNSNDEEDLNQLSIASPVSMSQCSSPVIFQNQTPSSFTIDDHSNNLHSQKTNRFYPSYKSSSKLQYKDEPHRYIEVKESHSAANKRKRKQHQTSSSSITTISKQSTRLAAKRIRIE